MEGDISGGVSVQVAVRVRPLSAQERSHGSTSIVSHPTDKSVRLGPERVFGFDHVFNESSKQQQIFTTLVDPMLNTFVDGFNASILAYGQTVRNTALSFFCQSLVLPFFEIRSPMERISSLCVIVGFW